MYENQTRLKLVRPYPCIWNSHSLSEFCINHYFNPRVFEGVAPPLWTMLLVPLRVVIRANSSVVLNYGSQGGAVLDQTDNFVKILEKIWAAKGFLFDSAGRKGNYRLARQRGIRAQALSLKVKSKYKCVFSYLFFVWKTA